MTPEEIEVIRDAVVEAMPDPDVILRMIREVIRDAMPDRRDILGAVYRSTVASAAVTRAVVDQLPPRP